MSPSRPHTVLERFVSQRLVAATIDGMDDAALRKAAERAIKANPKLTAAGREFLMKCDPRKSALVKAMIVDGRW